VVFAVDADRPDLRIAGDEYATCCDARSKKIERGPSRYLKL
jgi:hypothetical protein